MLNRAKNNWAESFDWEFLAKGSLFRHLKIEN